MTLSSASNLSEIQAEFDDNAGYDLNGSVAECKAFILAGRLLLRRHADESSHEETRLVQKSETIREMLAAAETWLKANDDDAGSVGEVLHPSMEYLRD